MDTEKRIQEILASDLERAGLVPSQAAEYYLKLQHTLQLGGGCDVVWKEISQKLLRSHHPHTLHQLMYYSTYRNWDESKLGPPPAWFPNLASAKETNVGKILEVHGNKLLNEPYIDPIASFSAFYKFSCSHPEIYWPLTFKELSLVFHVKPHCILDKGNDESIPTGRWLPGAVLNVAESCLSTMQSISKTDDSIAVIWRDEGRDNQPPFKMTLWELRCRANRVANALKMAGFRTGDTIAIDMPMHVQAVVTYLGIILAGCVVVSIADSFVSSEIAARLRISKATAIFTQDKIVRAGKVIPLYSRVAEANPHKAIVIASDGNLLSCKLRGEDLSWDEFLKFADRLSKPDEFKAVPLPIDAWTNILFSSGTTAEPKAIPWAQTTAIRCASDSWVHSDLKQGDVYCWPTNLGWMMGPYLISACLLTGSTIALYNGSPLGREFGKFVQDAGVTNLGTVPSMVKTWKKSNCMDGLDWSCIKLFGTTGETSNVDDDLWLSARASYKPVLECCGGTELGSAFLHSSLLQPQAFSTFSTPSMTTSFLLLDDSGKPYAEDEPCSGEIALFPQMLGASFTLLNANHYEVYFKGMPVIEGKRMRRHGDIFERMVGGYYKAKGRADDAMNLGGIKVSAVEIERVCNAAHPNVLETAAIALPPLGGGPDNLIIVAVLKKDVSRHTLLAAFASAVQSNLNPLFKVHDVHILEEMPRTASNKVMRRLLRAQLMNNQVNRSRL